jgi:hypothetical protein
MTLRAALILVVLTLLAGCATPLQQCLQQADRDRIAVQRELAERRQNLQRGYAVEQVIVPVMMPSFCAGPTGTLASCLLWEDRVDEVRHPINRTFEAERIALLERQLARAEADQARAAAQCRAVHPE